MAQLRRIVIDVLKTWKSQTEALRDLHAQVDSICRYLSERDPNFEEKFDRGEAIAQAAPDVLLASSLAIQELDQVIRRLEDGEELTL